MELPERQANCPHGFTLIELLVVIAVVGILASLLLPSLASTKESTLRTKCRSNLKQLSTAFFLYSDDHNGLLPDCTTNNPRFFGTWWPWDMNTNLTSDLNSYGAARNVFYCPSNPKMNDERHWEFWRFYEPSPTRVTGYVFLLNGGIQIPTNLWRINLSQGAGISPSETELITDATMNQNGDYTKVKGIWVDRTSHLTGSRPAGGSVAFEDGHVQWRDHHKMRLQIDGEAKWDF